MPAILVTDVPKRFHAKLRKQAIDKGVTLPALLNQIIKDYCSPVARKENGRRNY